ncbi:GNAT family N-acetyltransferase [Solemya elarraichensis gill symbiont]|uniref:GNAT family N-acetyltransferase n=2 Tax=Solemya elarraichensis gill symbiont TaxID=1918949 RepID=A0A1T2KZ01_9GAMM|nr:GNAT family N-acetyltransferase [Solemya elarraichensis gill symbiont]
MKVRRYKTGEEEALWSLLYETAHSVNSKDYSPAQIDAWAPCEKDSFQWANRLKGTNPFVAEENGELIGFAELENNGHIDCFYAAHNWQGKGVGSALLRAIEAEASSQGISSLFAEASITAKGFFQNHGFSIEGEQTVSLRGERFTNYAVSKRISS